MASIEEEQFNKPRWIDMLTMRRGPLTKYVNAQFAARLVETMDTGILILVAPACSELKKMMAHTVQLDRLRKADRP